MSSLHTLPRTVKRARRLGRGISAGQGKSAGRGTKGQKARSGFNIPAGFEGGQTKLFMRLPKLRGRRFPHRPLTATVTLTQLDHAFQDGNVVTLKTLRAKGLVGSDAKAAKIVGSGTLTKKLKFRGLTFTKAVYQAHVQR